MVSLASILLNLKSIAIASWNAVPGYHFSILKVARFSELYVLFYYSAKR